MDIKNKLREVVTSVVPITLLVLLLHFTLAPMSGDVLAQFLLGAFLLVVGQILFLLGADISILPMGEMVGSAITKTRNIAIVLVFGFLFGLMVTIAEPDVQVLGNQVASVNPQIQKSLLIFCVSFGVGIFVAIGLIRILTQFRLANALLILYSVIFILAAIAPNDYLAVAFDSGGVTTGPITVPFILSLGAGVSAVNGGKNAGEDSFGLVALASLGPIIAVLILGIVFGESTSTVTEGITSVGAHIGIIADFIAELPTMIGEVAVALLPMSLIFIFFQCFYLKLPKKAFRKILIGLIMTFVGLVLFLLGVNTGFSPMGTYIGQTLGSYSYRWVLIPLGLLIGFFVIYTEPAVRVLNDQVEEITNGYITKKTMLNALAIGVAFSVALSMIRVMAGFSLWFYLIPGYALSILLSRFVPPIFTAIAFDSGGVASGPMTATFILPMVIGVCSSVGGNILQDAFGIVAMVAMTPIITVQLVGLIYKLNSKSLDEEEKEELDQVSLEDDADYSGLM